MATHPAPRQLTVEQFLEEYDGVEGRWELWDGVPVEILEPEITRDGRLVMMAGATPRHQQISLNIAVALRNRLRGSGCQPFTGQQLRIDWRSTRLPDVAIYCDPADLDFRDDERRALERPRVIFEVLSPGTRRTDLGVKLEEYQAFESVKTIIFVDPVEQRLLTWERLSATEWRNVNHPPGASLALVDPAVTIPAEEIFARD